MNARPLLLLVTVGMIAVACGLCASARGEDFSWTGDAGTSGWDDVAPLGGEPPAYISNWGRIGEVPELPGSADDVIIAGAVGAEVLVDLDVAAAVNSLEVWDGMISVDALSLTAGDLLICSGGRLQLASAAADVTVTNVLKFGTNGAVSCVAGSTIHVTGSAVQSESRQPAKVIGLADAKLIFEGGAAQAAALEVAGQDVGTYPDGWFLNHVIGTLQLGGADVGHLTLVNDFENQCHTCGVEEGIYVNDIVLNAGAQLALNGLNLYYLNGGDPKKLYYGDVNLDGAVDVADLGQISTYYGQGGTDWSKGDFNGDGAVDIADLGAMATNYGAGTGGGVVPEPSCAALLVIAGLGLLRRRSKK